MLKAIFFDFGDTLISNQVFNLGGDLRAIEKIIEIYNLDEKPSECLLLAKEAQDHIVRKVTEGEWLRYGNESSQQFSVRLKKAFCARLIEFMGETSDEKSVEQVFEAYLEGIATADSLFPETLEALESLKVKYKLGLISNNMIESVTGPFQHFGLGRFFEVVIISAEEEVDKPAPEIFHRALKRMGVAASEAMMVGDHLIDDVKGAKDVGMTAVWVHPVRKFVGLLRDKWPGLLSNGVDRSGEKPNLDVEPDYVIRNLKELLDIV